MLRTCNVCLGGSDRPLPLLVTSLGRRVVSRCLGQRKLRRVGGVLCRPKCVPGARLPTICDKTSIFVCASLHRDFNVPVLRTVTYKAPIVASAASTVPRVTKPRNVLIGPFRPRRVTSTLLRLRRGTRFCRSRATCKLREIHQFS